MSVHAEHMRRALELALVGELSARPNPMVGAVVVADGKRVGEGFHIRAGGPHAEIHALAAAGKAAQGADLYCTLEPCNHSGRTGPCTEAVIAAGIKRVFIGALDPNSWVAGKGVERLRAAGIEVVSGIEEAACTAANEVFNHWISEFRPFVTLKLAMSLDGRIAGAPGLQTQITGEEARRRVHYLRASSEAILVGARTVAADNPRLTAREVTPLSELAGDIDQPRAVIVDSTLRTPNSARVFDRPGSIVATALDARELVERRAPYVSRGAEVWSVPGPDGRVDLAALMGRLGKLEPRPVTSLFVEGGGEIAASMMSAGLVDRWLMHMGGTVIGAGGVPSVAMMTPQAQRRQWRIVQTRSLGADVEMEVRPCSQD